MSRTFPTRDGRWGARQLCRGELTGGGTYLCGWSTRQEAEAANPPHGDYEYIVYDRFQAAEDGAA